MTVCLSVPRLQHVSAADSLHEHKVHQLEIYKKEEESKICLSKDEIGGWIYLLSLHAVHKDSV